jgi:hypothetical protein
MPQRRHVLVAMAADELLKLIHFALNGRYVAFYSKLLQFLDAAERVCRGARSCGDAGHELGLHWI